MKIIIKWAGSELSTVPAQRLLGFVPWGLGFRPKQTIALSERCTILKILIMYVCAVVSTTKQVREQRVEIRSNRDSVSQYTTCPQGPTKGSELTAQGGVNHPGDQSKGQGAHETLS